MEDIWKKEKFDSALYEATDNFFENILGKKELEYREGQHTMALDIVDSITNRSILLIEAGTGTGKSAIAATLANMSESSYILTVTKQLQEQYLRDFNDFKVVKGRSNFQCQNYINQSCKEGKCLIEGYDCKFSLKNRENEIRKDNTCP